MKRSFFKINIQLISRHESYSSQYGLQEKHSTGLVYLGLVYRITLEMDEGKSIFFNLIHDIRRDMFIWMIFIFSVFESCVN